MICIHEAVKPASLQKKDWHNSFIVFEEKHSDTKGQRVYLKQVIL